MSSKKLGYKYQIEQALLEKGWEINYIGANENWWDDEHWIVGHQWNLDVSFYLVFIVDPQFEGNRKSGQGIYEVMASTTFPKNWNDNSTEIASISMTKRKFQVKLEEFMEGLGEWIEKLKD